MNKFQEELRKRTFGYITTAFGLVAGLAWNEAIKAVIERFFPMGDGGMIAKFVYAVIITAILVFVSLYILKTDKDKVEAEKAKK
ncbi:MAG: DUF5654 family protein [Candidatus Moranbacteria bacterium]|nr:DUF5654 family protein [Candidatus Moranbacteria bacterium]